MPDYTKTGPGLLSLIETTRGQTGERSMKTIRHYHQDIRAQLSKLTVCERAIVSANRPVTGGLLVRLS